MGSYINCQNAELNLATSTIKRPYTKESVSASYEISVNSGAIACAISDDLLLVTGYLSAVSQVPANTTIAKVGHTVSHQSFASPVSNLGDGTRLVLRTNGNIDCEKEMKAGEWYSYTMVAFVN